MTKITIIIPFRDKISLLQKCVRSIFAKTSHTDYEIILVDNGSREDATLKYLGEIKENDKVQVLEYDKPFNFSAINNFAAKNAKGEYLLFLNNDTEVISENWLEKMLECFIDENIGVVGAKLLYPDDTIQHIGVMLEEKRLAIHAFRTWKEDAVKVADKKEWKAVTGACLMTKKDLFLKLGGFDEQNLPIAYNDVDYCLRAGELGYKVICVSNIKLYHYESASRKSDVKVFYKFLKFIRFLKFKKIERYRQFLQEQEFMRKKWSKEISNDPFYNPEFI